jgi:hypothetical protein
MIHWCLDSKQFIKGKNKKFGVQRDMRVPSVFFISPLVILRQTQLRQTFSAEPENAREREGYSCCNGLAQSEPRDHSLQCSPAERTSEVVALPHDPTCGVSPCPHAERLFRRFRYRFFPSQFVPLHTSTFPCLSASVPQGLAHSSVPVSPATCSLQPFA